MTSNTSSTCSPIEVAIEILDCREIISEAEKFFTGLSCGLPQPKHVLHIEQPAGLVLQEARSTQAAVSVGDSAR